jgi:hypothetical protein
MGMFRLSILAAAAVTLVSCATPYQDYGVLGGLDAKELRPNVDRVSFQGNGLTTRESVQVYWLNRCAELAIEKGYAGFEVLSDIQFVMHHPSSDDGVRLASFVPSLRTRIPVSPDEVADFSVSRDRDSLASLSAEPIRLAGTIFIYGGGEGASVPKPAN